MAGLDSWSTSREDTISQLNLELQVLFQIQMCTSLLGSTLLHSPTTVGYSSRQKGYLIFVCQDETRIHLFHSDGEIAIQSH